MYRIMQALVCLLLLLAAPAASLKVGNEKLLILPPPQSISASGSPLALSPSLTLESTFQHSYLDQAFSRFVGRLPAAPAAALPTGPLLTSISVATASQSVHLGESTDYSYTIALDASAPGTLRITAASVYGAVYALESLSQLVEASAAGAPQLSHSALRITDAPAFAWRGLMVDAGRRFFPMPVLSNLLDTMLAVKLNVLHLHASDECRFAVESKLYPNLTASLQGVLGGFYTQEDVGTLVAQAGARGIRVVPEFDIPSHSRGLRPIKSQGIVFCEDVESQSQVYNDPANSTLTTLLALFGEVSALFPDQVLHIGADETSSLGPCTTESTFSLERSVLNHLEGALNKTAAGWEEVLFDAGAATNKTIVYAWSRHTPQEIIDMGRRAVDSASGDFYMTSPAPPYPGGWENFYADIASGVNPQDLSMLLGGEMR